MFAGAVVLLQFLIKCPQCSRRLVCWDDVAMARCTCVPRAIFTRADVIANVGVIVAALLVIVTASRTPDLVVGLAIGAYVIKVTWEILRDASSA